MAESENLDSQTYTEEDAAAEEEKIRAMQRSSRRAAVAAQSVNKSMVEDFQAPVYPKSAADAETIKTWLKGDDKLKVLFGHLEGESLRGVIDAFYEQESQTGDTIIKQGEDGHCMYLIREGFVDVYVERPGADGNMVNGKVATLNSGALFGELALMYSAPRAATIIVASPTAKFWALEREPFQMLLAQSGQRTYEKYEGWLKEVDILKTLNHFELAKLSEAMESELFEAGEDIIVQGDVGDKFYILEEGTCAVIADGAEVMTYDQKGMYFGERALILKEPRAATIRATGTGAVVASLSEEQFTNLLGPITEILKVHIDKYPSLAHLIQQA